MDTPAYDLKEQEPTLSEIQQKIEENEAEMIQTLQELIAIKSVEEPETEEFPFGEGVHQALHYILKKAESDGFRTRNVDEFGAHIEFGGTQYQDQKKETEVETIGILTHLDVVPEGDGWKGEPYSGEITDGKIFGRGSSDDKGPLIAAYFAMRALRDVGYEPQKKVRLILGLDEETNWRGMEYYLKKVPPVDFGFAPDAKFPVIHGEMGLLVFEIAKKINKSVTKGIVFRGMSGGLAANVVADQARLLLRSDSYDAIKEKLAQFKEETGYDLTARQRGKSLEIEAKGKTAHGAEPWKGLNAISVLMAFAKHISFTNEDVNDFIEFYNNHIAWETDGASFGCGLSDEISGNLILNVGMLKVDEGAARLLINVRYPLTVTEEAVFRGMEEILEAYNLGLIKKEHKLPLYRPVDDALVQTLMQVYQKHTGDKKNKPIVIGGATFARAMPNTVAFGALFPEEENRMHQKDESISLDSLKKAASIYAEAIFRLADAKKYSEKK
ncbi:dipeptidase PepV [Sinanaerobacter sp. ZZT-01]|uniref:dipeptidase PepV n=1 Tax=Sinanaerobacter sp. ZZT-01 TaxID=3111540 RepID=UPI002D7692A6|nr:dipeptidase PepV [Sinanaerobacter sp. ZZT-01]WRR94418.1 dipeptidase PepV [Sinanaerobacter sp. ZZT-01]